MMDFVEQCSVEFEEQYLSSQFLQLQENQGIDLQEYLERYCNALSVFGFNNANFMILF